MVAGMPGRVRFHAAEPRTRWTRGRGIGPEFLPHVFEAFSQETEQAGAGLGVGLSVVRQLVSLHEGTVAAHSEGRGKGSTFAVSIPLSS